MAGELPDITSPIAAHVDGLLAWWALSGVDSAVGEDPVNWLRPAVAPSALAPAASAPSPSTTAPDALPDTLTAFHEHLAHVPDLAEAAWHGARCLPIGPQAPRLMIVLPSPDTPDAHLQPDAMKLLENMMRAIGLNLSDCYLASLSLIQPTFGTIDPPLLDALARRMRHHIALVQPRALLLLGDQTNRALEPTNGSSGEGNLPFVNHVSGKIAAASIIHPRLMLAQPAAKAQAWQSLRRLVKRWE